MHGPNGERSTIPKTNSDWRGPLNVLKDLRKVGLDLPVTVPAPGGLRVGAGADVPASAPRNADSGALPPGGEVAARAGFEHLADGFLLPYSESTRAAYARDIADFAAYCAGRGADPLAADRRLIEGFAAARAGQGLSGRTVARRLAALAGLFRYALEERAVPRDPMALVRRPRAGRDSPRAGLDAREVRALLAAAGRHSPRAHALVGLLVGTGLRISEAVGADVGDLARHGQHRTLRVVRKGGRRALVPLSEPVAAGLDGYLAERRSGPLFLSRSGRRLDRGNAARLVRAVARTALPDRADVSPHTCRHAFVTLALNAGVPLRDVAAAVGHRATTTTQLYDHGRLGLERHAAYVLARRLARPATEEPTGVLEQDQFRLDRPVGHPAGRRQEVAREVASLPQP